MKQRLWIWCRLNLAPGDSTRLSKRLHSHGYKSEDRVTTTYTYTAPIFSQLVDVRCGKYTAPYVDLPGPPITRAYQQFCEREELKIKNAPVVRRLLDHQHPLVRLQLQIRRFLITHCSERHAGEKREKKWQPTELAKSYNASAHSPCSSSSAASSSLGSSSGRGGGRPDEDDEAQRIGGAVNALLLAANEEGGEGAGGGMVPWRVVVPGRVSADVAQGFEGTSGGGDVLVEGDGEKIKVCVCIPCARCRRRLVRTRRALANWEELGGGGFSLCPPNPGPPLLLLSRLWDALLGAEKAREAAATRLTASRVSGSEAWSKTEKSSSFRL